MVVGASHSSAIKRSFGFEWYSLVVLVGDLLDDWQHFDSSAKALPVLSQPATQEVPEGLERHGFLLLVFDQGSRGGLQEGYIGKAVRSHDQLETHLTIGTSRHNSNGRTQVAISLREVKRDGSRMSPSHRLEAVDAWTRVISL